MREGFFTGLGLVSLSSLIFLVEHPRWQLVVIAFTLGCVFAAIHGREIGDTLTKVLPTLDEIKRWESLVKSKPRKRKGCRYVGARVNYFPREKKA